MIDTAKLTLKAGDGGAGLASFRREKFVPKGGPDGGDGGKGGDVVIYVNPRFSTLIHLRGLNQIAAQSGHAGQKSRKTGKSGEDQMIDVPPGTQIIDLTNGDLIVDLDQPEQKYLIARGGKGGLGNCHFATATRQTPLYAQPGIKGEEKKIGFELKILADVGIIGLPNVGKSSLLKCISNANPKIGAYPFTTLEPNLGIVSHKGQTFVAADIPGLIEGAHQGKGLGIQFLRHVERTKVIIHLVDAQSADWEKDYQTVRSELNQYSKKLLQKREIVALNKIDALQSEDRRPKNFINKHRAVKISAATRVGISALLDKIIELLAT